MSTISIQTKKMGELEQILSADDDNLLIIHNDNGMKTITVGNLKEDLKELINTTDNKLAQLTYNNAGAHNAIYRGRALGSFVTAAQYDAISNGTFKDLYIGDYWTIGNVNYRIAAFDYYLNCGDTNCIKHHVVLVPDSCLYSANMNNSDTTTGGYVGSEMYTANLENAKTTIENAFSGHVLKHRLYFSNAVSNGYASAGVWVDSEVDLMCSHMVYGNGVFSPVSTGDTVPNNYRVEKSQLPLFAFDPSRISLRRDTWWLRDVITASLFACVDFYGRASYNHANFSNGIRPAFAIS